MTVFQLDQCLNNRRLAEGCNAEGLVGVWRFPSRMAQRSTLDPEILSLFMASDRPLLTTDGRLPWEHTAHIPHSHPGIVVVRSNARHTIRIDDVRRILSGMKQRLADWHLLSWRNSVVELWPDAIDVYHVERGLLQHDLRVSFDAPDWATGLVAQLAENASRS